MQGQIITAKAGADLSAKEGYHVKLSAVNNLTNEVTVVLAGANEIAHGCITGDSEGSGYGVPIAVDGFYKAILGVGGATLGQELKVDSAGTLIGAGGTGDDNVVAEAWGTGSAGDKIMVKRVRYIK